MSHHAPKALTDVDKAVLGTKADRPWLLLNVAGAVAIILAFAYTLITGQGEGASRFAFAYTVGFAFAMAITLGNLFFVIITTLFRAGWCAAIRRVAETYAANIVTLAALFIPVLLCVWATDGSLYPWTKAGIHEAGDALAHHGKPAPFLPDRSGDAHSSASPFVDARIQPAATGPTEGHGASEHTPYAAPETASQAAPEAAHPIDSHDAAANTSANHNNAPASHDVGHNAEHATAPSSGDTHAQAQDSHAEHSANSSHDTQHAAEHGSEHGGEHGDAHGDDHAVWTHTAEHWRGHNHAVPFFVYKKGLYLTRGFYTVRWVIYLLVWGLVGRFFYKNSLRQDQTGDVSLTNRREWWAPLSVAAFAVTITLASFDLLMSIDPVWYSTMFGVYFFAGAFIAGISTIILTLMAGQKYDYFPAVTTEHFHDLGKLLFAFVFFWGYVGFSQFMLIWYASLPETTYWWAIRGVTTLATEPTYGGAWSKVAILLLFGHLFIPFAFLLSKHVKRNRKALMVTAIWMLFMCWLDLFWITLPALSSPKFLLPIPELLCAAGCVAILVGGALKIASRASLTAYNDPRMHESLALDTTAWAPIHPEPKS